MIYISALGTYYIENSLCNAFDMKVALKTKFECKCFASISILILCYNKNNISKQNEFPNVKA